MSKISEFIPTDEESDRLMNLVLKLGTSTIVVVLGYKAGDAFLQKLLGKMKGR